MPEVSGDLSVMPLADLSIWLANRRRSGRLRVCGGQVEKSFDVFEGAIVRGTSNDPREYFGQFLVHYGLLTEDQLQRAFQTQNETKVLLGRILVMIGIVPEEQVIQMLRVKLSETLLDAFRWEEGTFVFEERATPKEERPLIEIQIPLEQVHREGEARVGMWRDYQRLFPDRRWVVQVIEDRVPATATEDTLDGRILTLARRGLTIDGMTLDLHATDYQVAERLLSLNACGAIVAREPSTTLLPLQSGSAAREHVVKARQAAASGRRSEALRWVQEGLQAYPGDPGLEAIREELRASMDPTADLDRSRVPVMVADLGAEQLKRLSAKQRYVLARIDGRRSVEAIIQVSPMVDHEAVEILRQFEAERLIRLT